MDILKFGNDLKELMAKHGIRKITANDVGYSKIEYIPGEDTLDMRGMNVSGIFDMTAFNERLKELGADYSAYETITIEDFWEGEYHCVECGKGFELHWNGGELDRHECCGIEYRTDHKKVDLVIERKCQ